MSVWKLKPRTKSSQPSGPTIEKLSTNEIRQKLECLKKRQAELNAPLFEPYQEMQSRSMRPMENQEMTTQSAQKQVRKFTREEIMNRIEYLLKDDEDQDETIKEINGIRLSRHDFATLKDHVWLNDKIIDAYMELIMQRSQRSSFPKVYAFTTYFYTAFETKGYSGVARWTSSVNIFDYDILLFPIHSGGHRSLVAFDKEHNCFAYSDSMLYSDAEVTRSVATCYARDISDYLEQESEKTHKGSYNKRTATIVNFDDIPTQEHESDCGVFLCSYAENITRHHFSTFTFNQLKVRYLRRKICFELGQGRLLE